MSGNESSGTLRFDVRGRYGIPEPWETQPGWERHVAAPVARHALAPREARVILEIAGRMADLGYSGPELAMLLTGSLPTEVYDGVVAPPPPVADDLGGEGAA